MISPQGDFSRLPSGRRKAPSRGLHSVDELEALSSAPAVQRRKSRWARPKTLSQVVVAAMAAVAASKVAPFMMATQTTDPDNLLPATFEPTLRPRRRPRRPRRPKQNASPAVFEFGYLTPIRSGPIVTMVLQKRSLQKRLPEATCCRSRFQPTQSRCSPWIPLLQLSPVRVHWADLFVVK